MKAMLLERSCMLKDVREPLQLVDLPRPTTGDQDLLIQIAACGVCHTELDEIEGRLVPPRLPVVPGHEVIGHVVQRGPQVTKFQLGDRVGVGWIHHSCGGPDENLSGDFVATGCDVNGGYAEYMTVPQDYAVSIPKNLTDTQAAPLMCAGAIGYRALRLTGIRDGDPLGLMGFGGSGHLVLPTAKHCFPRSPVFVFARDASVQRFAIERGADWAGPLEAVPPEPLQAIIDTTPAWKPLVESMKKLRPGGRLVVNAIRKEDADKSELLRLNYHQHLWMEREIKSVANLTHADIAGFLPLAAAIALQPDVKVYRLEQANEALQNLRRGNIKGANVLQL